MGATTAHSPGGDRVARSFTTPPPRFARSLHTPPSRFAVRISLACHTALLSAFRSFATPSPRFAVRVSLLLCPAFWVNLDYWNFVDRVDHFVRGSTSRSCFPLLSLSLFPVRTVFGRSLVIQCSFSPVVLDVLGQPRLLDLCGSS